MKPLTYALLKHAEEAAEVGHDDIKAALYGLDATNPDGDHQTNAERRRQELIDLLAAELMISVFSGEQIAVHLDEVLDKVKKNIHWMINCDAVRWRDIHRKTLPEVGLLMAIANGEESTSNFVPRLYGTNPNESV